MMNKIFKIIKTCWILIVRWHSSLSVTEVIGFWAGIATLIPVIWFAARFFGFLGSIITVVIIALVTTIYFLKKYCIHPSTNPFKCGGTLSPDAPSYIRRKCDNELVIALKEKTLIGITGEYRIGKSSLLMQVPTLTKVDWKDCFMDFQSMRTDDFKLFTKEFFKKVGTIFAGVDSWEDLAKSLEHQPVIFRFDEFGSLGGIASEFIPKLYNLYDPQSGVNKNIRIVVCSPKPIDALFKEINVDNPKYLSNWHTISVEPFTPKEIQQLLNLLPNPNVVARIVRARLNRIQELSSNKPLALQCLCHRLFKAIQEGQSQKKLITIITNPDSYK